jgi:cytidine deaminase
MQVVSFDPRYLDWVRDGIKTRTARYSEPVELGPARFRFESEPPVFLDAVVTGIREVALDALEDDDAAAENFADADALRNALRYHYPGLPHDAVVAVLSFDLI